MGKHSVNCDAAVAVGKQLIHTVNEGGALNSIFDGGGGGGGGG